MYEITSKLFITGLSTFLVGLCFTSSASAATITKDGKYMIKGISRQPITSFTGTGTSIMIDLGTGPVSSGEISLTLDTSSVPVTETTNTLSVDFDTQLITLDINLLVSSEELDSMGIPPSTINIIETAPLPDVNIIEVSSPSGTTDIDYIVDDGTIEHPSPPLLPPQMTDIIGDGTLECLTTTPCFTMEFLDVPTEGIEFMGGGTIDSGALTGFEYTNTNNKAFIYNLILHYILLWGGLPPGITSLETTADTANTKDTIKPTDTEAMGAVICPIPEPSAMLGVLTIGLLGMGSIFAKKHQKIK